MITASNYARRTDHRGRDIYPSRFIPSPCHRFIKVVEDKGKVSVPSIHFLNHYRSSLTAVTRGSYTVILRGSHSLTI